MIFVHIILENHKVVRHPFHCIVCFFHSSNDMLLSNFFSTINILLHIPYPTYEGDVSEMTILLIMQAISLKMSFLEYNFGFVKNIITVSMGISFIYLNKIHKIYFSLSPYHFCLQKFAWRR